MVLDEARGARTAGAATVVAAPRWYVVWTRSHSEPLVEDQLAARGFRVFNPQIDVWSRRRQQRHRIQVPMFPGYLFVHHVLDKESDIEIRKVRGVVAILGETWERRAVVPDPEIDAICTLTRSGLAAMPHPFAAAIARHVAQHFRMLGGKFVHASNDVRRSRGRARPPIHRR